MQGKLILVIGPSGSGKSALMSYLRHSASDIVFPVSCTTRAQRPGEAEGETYYFISDAAFDARLAQDAFLEWASYGGHRYGTLKSEVLPALAQRKTVVREVEVQGARQLLKLLPAGQVATIFITAGSWEELAARIAARAPVTPEELAARKERYADEMQFAAQADICIENKNGDLAHAQALFIAAVERLRK